jgi:MoxR-like ATPase
MPQDTANLVRERARRHLVAALRRVRIDSALALAEQNRTAESDLQRLQAKLSEATLAEEAALIEGGPTLPFARLLKRLQLNPLGVRMLMVYVALELDPLFAITVSALAGEEPRQGLSAKVMAQIFRFGGDEALELALSSSHPLVRTALLEGSTSQAYPDSLRPYRLAPRVASFLEGADEIDPLLRRAGNVVEVPSSVEGPDGLAHARGAEELAQRVIELEEDVIVCVEGMDGVGRRTLCAAVARRYGREVVSIDLGRLSAERTRASAELRALRRECWLRGAVPLVARLDALSRGDARRNELLTEVGEMLEGDGAMHGPAFVTGVTGVELPETRRRVLRVRVDPPGVELRHAIWSRALGLEADTLSVEREVEGQAAGPTVTLSEVVQLYALTPGSIGRAAANARLLSRGRAPSAGELRAGVQAEIQERFGGLAQRVATTQGWDDLVLPQDTLDDVKAFGSRAVNATKVYETWGFRRKLQKGLGLAALFSGPPGTGKTMVAGLIAQSLGLEMYMVDLSQVVSKWVGETEKQLGKIFDAAQMGNVVLLFDEADALFAKRTEVKSSNDRYANLEVNYLLTRLESFGGVAILTTNLEASVDPAFKRRLAAEVRFYAPEQPERERLWSTILPKETPVEGKLDFTRLADRYKELAGGHIRNAVLRAAFLAANEEGVVTQSVLERAATSEYRAMGKVL